MDSLVEGYRRFRVEVWPFARARYEGLAKGQAPQTLVIACSDSRVDPQTVFNAAPGTMFSIRNIAGLVPVYAPDKRHHGTSAALEYAVRVLEVAHIVVLGHAQCGGVRAMVEGTPDIAHDFVEPWVDIARPAVERMIAEHPTGENLLPDCEIEVVRLSLANLMTFPWVAERVAAGRLELLGFRFDIHTGTLIRIDAGTVATVT